MTMQRMRIPDILRHLLQWFLHLHWCLQIYKDFFEWAGKPEMFKMRKNRMLEYADMAPLAYLHLAHGFSDSVQRPLKLCEPHQHQDPSLFRQELQALD